MKELSAMLKHIQHYGMGLFLVPLILSAAVWSLYTYGSQQKLPAGVTISGWIVGEMPYSQFMLQLQEKYQSLAEKQVLLRSPLKEVESKQLTLGELGLAIDDEELTAALKSLFEGSILARAQHRWKMKHKHLELRFTFKAAQLTKTIEQNWQELYSKEPVPAKRVILANDAMQYEAEQTVLRIRTEELGSRLKAHVTSVGLLFETRDLVTIELPLYERSPSVTLQSLKDQGIERKIMEFTTHYTASSEGRIYNIQATAASIQGLLLRPGEIFDFAKVIRQTEADYGYKEAPVIVNGKLVPGIGGGICQVSTTLYNAVLRSGLEVLERRNHSLPISYVPLGQDATFASGYINFTFRNNTNKFLLIRTLATNEKLTVKLFGDTSPFVTYDIESTLVKTLDPPVQFVHNPTLDRGTTLKLLEGKPGYIVETRRYKKENGIVIQNELVSTDRYSPEPTLIAANNTSLQKDQQPMKPPSKPIIEDGIAGPLFH
jgi:vancomycin resistance protein YoaR